jgi:hypothetical protein
MISEEKLFEWPVAMRDKYEKPQKERGAVYVKIISIKALLRKA